VNGNGAAVLRIFISIMTTVILALVGALWFNLNSEISELKADVRGLQVSVNDLRLSEQDIKARYDKLVDIFNNASATRARK
jgi:hypothetical protein